MKKSKLTGALDVNDAYQDVLEGYIVGSYGSSPSQVQELPDPLQEPQI